MGALMDLRLMAPREDMAKAICRRFQASPEQLYGAILSLLLQDGDS